MKAIHKLFACLSILIIGFLLISAGFLQQVQPKPWIVPDEYKNMENPVPATPESINSGAALYNKNCASCHGKTGLGNGVRAKMLETFPGDFSGPAYHTQTDGEHFYKTKAGRDEMPAYAGKFSDEEIWNMVNYMATFKK